MGSLDVKYPHEFTVKFPPCLLKTVRFDRQRWFFFSSALPSEQMDGDLVFKFLDPGIHFYLCQV